MLTGKKAVIFDMDGSLVDSMWIWPEVDRIYMEKYHLVQPDTFHKDIEGSSYTETAQYFVDTFPSLNRTVEQVMREWRDMTIQLYREKVFPKPGALDFLKTMNQRGILLGIATSNDREIAEAALNARGLAGYFQSVRTSCEVSAGKPAPDVYLKVAEDLHVAPEKCLVFEDVPNGIRAGKNAGMEVCAVDDEFSRPDEQEKMSLADYYIHDYYDIKNRTYLKCGSKRK
nr:HAD family phosphatase [uncultured Mediterraneibacter sp.]